MIHFGVIHATYRDRHTMPQTVASLYAAGVPHVTLFPDTGVYGALRNLERALRHLVSMASDSDHVCVVDDDLHVCPDALLIMEDALRTDPQCIHSFYTVEHSIRHIPESERSGWVNVFPSFADTWGGMVVLPKAVASDVLSHTYFQRYSRTHKEGKHCDTVLYETIRMLGHSVYLHIPSLATDISDGSSTIGTTNKESLAGYRFDNDLKA